MQMPNDFKTVPLLVAPTHAMLLHSLTSVYPVPTSYCSCVVSVPHCSLPVMSLYATIAACRLRGTKLAPQPEVRIYTVHQSAGQPHV